MRKKQDIDIIQENWKQRKRKGKEMEEKKRVQFWDIARGIAIILMLIGHTLPRECWGVKIAYSFHMPLFVIASGYFFKEDEKIGTTIKNICLKLLLPTILVYIIAQWTFYEIIHLPVSGITKLQVIARQLFQSGFNGLNVLWFLPFLGGIRLLFAIVFKITKGKESLVGVLCFLFFIIGYQLGEHQITLPLQMDLVLTCLFLYDVGHLLRKKQLLPWIWKRKWLFAILVGIWITIAFLSEVDIARAIYGKYGIGLLGAVCGTIVVCKISEKLEKIPGIANFLAFCGKNSMAILLIHQLERKTILIDRFLKKRIPIGEILMLRLGIDIAVGIVYGGIKEKIIQMRKTLKVKKESKNV